MIGRVCNLGLQEGSEAESDNHTGTAVLEIDWAKSNYTHMCTVCQGCSVNKIVCSSTGPQSGQMESTTNTDGQIKSNYIVLNHNYLELVSAAVELHM